LTSPATTTAAPAPPAPSSLAAALPRRWRVATALSLLLAPIALWRFGIDAEGLVGIVFFAALAALALKDLEERRIPNVIVLPTAALVLLAVAVLQPHHLLEAVVAAFAAALFLLLPSLFSRGAVGMGDVKLGFLLGAALGRGIALALFLGCVCASVVGIRMIFREGASARKATVAFAPFLVLGAVAAVALGAAHAL
jgi:prepilin signal peptidase PulO-like enzyme (type II secretory pathway)